jgi:hypothetical protein
MKARIVRYGFIGVVAVLIILCGMKFSNMYKDYQKLQFNQEQIDTQVSVLMSMLFSDLYYSDPIDLGETKEHADELSVLLQVTSYDEIPHFNDIANKLMKYRRMLSHVRHLVNRPLNCFKVLFTILENLFLMI